LCPRAVACPELAEGRQNILFLAAEKPMSHGEKLCSRAAVAKTFFAKPKYSNSATIPNQPVPFPK